MVGQDGVAKQIDAEEFGEIDQFGLHPLLAVVKVFARDGIISQQEASANCLIMDMDETISSDATTST